MQGDPLDPATMKASPMEIPSGFDFMFFSSAPADQRVVIAERAYKLLTEQVGFPPEDILFDPNVFAIGDCAAAPWLGHTGNVPPRAQASSVRRATSSRSRS